MDATRVQLEQDTVAAFQTQFGSEPAVIASAPGRVNLIGEHTDYNEGFVLPATINRAIAIAARPRSDSTLRLYSVNFRQSASVDLRSLARLSHRPWVNYVSGVAMVLQQLGDTLDGADLVVNGNVPRGSGLSSSAALEMAAASVFQELNGLSHTDIELIGACQRAENEFVGVKCGIMDQFISRLGRRGHALLIDCRSLTYDHVPLPSGVRVLILDTGVQRALTTSAYNQRRDECAEGVRRLSLQMPGIRSLRDISSEQLAAHGHALAPPLLRRCRHVVTENDRVQQAAHALRAGELSVVGKLMYDSHLSLERDYEVSCDELDAMVDICAECDGVYGARMTGAGFGGCAVCLVMEEKTDIVVERVLAEYPAKTGKTPTVLNSIPDDGATARTLDAHF